MPESARDLYIEAGNVLDASPRAAAALLRMCTEDVVKTLTPDLGNKKTLNQRIGHLVKEHNLPDRVQQALDVLRIAGDNAVHSPTINLGDDMETATALFDLVDVIVAEMLSPKEATNRFYDRLPEIETRTNPEARRHAMRWRKREAKTCRDCHFLATGHTTVGEWSRQDRDTLNLHGYNLGKCYRGKWPPTRDKDLLEEILAQDRTGAGCFLPYVPGATFRAGEHREQHQHRMKESRRSNWLLSVGVATLLPPSAQSGRRAAWPACVTWCCPHPPKRVACNEQHP